MAISESYQVEELDDHSREYLRAVRENKGKGLPGIYIPKTNALPAVGLFVGLVVLIAVGVISANVMTEEPLSVAMLESAGLLLGGWMVVAAFRVWSASKSRRYAGHFIFCDADTLWECSGTALTTTDVIDVEEARGVQNYNEGKYQNTLVTLKLTQGTKKLTVTHEERARQLIEFLNVLAWMRTSGSAVAPSDASSAEAIDYKKLSSPLLGGAAKHYAKTGEIAQRLTAEDLEIDVEEIPIPQKVGRASSGLINYLIILAIGGVSVLAFWQLNIGWRDDAIWDNIADIDYRDYRAVWLRLYLKDERNTKHRAEAKTMLLDLYQKNIDRMRGGAFVGVNVQPPKMVGFPPGPNLNVAPQNLVKPDKDLLDGLEMVLLSLADEVAVPLIKVSIAEVGPLAVENEAAQRKKAIGEKYIQTLVDGVGPELINCYATDGPPGLIELEYEFKPVGNGRAELRFTVKYRKSLEGEVVKTATWTASAANSATATLEQVAKDLGEKTVGPKKPPGPARELAKDF